MSIIKGTTKVIGIIGQPITHSLSPLMHNRAFAALDMDYCYVPFEVKPENLSKAMEGFRAMNLAGLNVTIPHKEAVIPLLDEVDEQAAAIGAVNTILNRKGRLIGYNTDGTGFLMSLEKDLGLAVRGLKVVMLGAGGAARGVAMELARAGMGELVMINRNLIRAQELVKDVTGYHKTMAIKAVPWEEGQLTEALKDAQVLINTTPVGMYPYHQVPSVVPPEALPEGIAVCDLIYNPLSTSLLAAAQEKGLKTLSGLGMLLYQGVLGFELWTGQKAPVDIMREALERGMAGKD